MTLVNDSAIKGYQEDVLERKDFAYNIADIVAKRTENDAFSIGLMGAWGSGKSSVLNLIEERFQKCHKDIITIFFNPWRYSGEEELLMFFFNEIAAGLDSKLKTNGDLVRNFFKTHTEKVGTLISAASGDPSNTGQKVASWLSGFLKTSDLVDFKERVQQLLIENNKKVVIYIDDIDRLPNKEIQELFKVIKLMGDFNHVTYILSFDKDVVTQALGQTYSSQKSSTFLEKIIQLQIEVPLINKKILIKEWKNSLDRVLNSNSINFDDKEWFELQESLEKGFLHNLDDLRKIKNIENSLSYVLPILKDKVYVVDLIVIESMRFFYPNLYSSLKYKKIDIFDERKDFDERVALYNNSNAQDERNKRIIKEFYEITRIKEISNYHGILSVIKKLFPTIKRFFTGSNYGFETQEFKAKLRVGSVDFFERYFSYNLNLREIPESLIKELLFELKDNSEFNIKINELLSQYEHYEIINKIFIYMDFVEDKTMVIVSLLACYNLFDNQYYNNDFFPIRNRERFLRNIVNFIESHNILQDLMVDKIILEKMDDELFVDFSILILGHNMINMETKKYLSQSLISRMEDNFNILDYPKSFEISSLIHLLKQSESFDVENYLNKVIKSERDIVIFLTSFCSFINSERVIKFDVEIIKNIHQAYCSDALTKKIEEICPKYLDAKESELKESVIGKYLITRNAT